MYAQNCITNMHKRTCKNEFQVFSSQFKNIFVHAFEKLQAKEKKSIIISLFNEHLWEIVLTISNKLIINIRLTFFLVVFFYGMFFCDVKYLFPHKVANLCNRCQRSSQLSFSTIANIWQKTHCEQTDLAASIAAHCWS